MDILHLLKTLVCALNLHLQIQHSEGKDVVINRIEDVLYITASQNTTMVNRNNLIRVVEALDAIHYVPATIALPASLCDTFIHTLLQHRWRQSTLACSGQYHTNLEEDTSSLQCCGEETPHSPVPLVSTTTGSSTTVPLGKVLNAVLKRMKWTSAIVFYESFTGARVESIVEELTACDEHRKFSLSDMSTLDREGLQHALLAVIANEPTDMKRFILICNESRLIDILSVASSLDDRSTGITSMSAWLGVVVASRRHAVERLAPLLDNLALVTYPQILNSIPNVKTATISTSWTGHVETLMYKSSGRALNTVASFSLNGTIVFEADIFPNIKYGFNRRHLVASTKEYYPYVRIHRNGTRIEYEGLCVDLLAQLADALNFTFQIIGPPDDQWGTFRNGSWDGLIRQLQYKEVDVVVAPLTVRQDREKVMDFTYPYFYDEAGAIFKRPDLKRFATLVRPFKWEVLLSLGGVVLFSTLLLYIMEVNRRDLVHEDDRILQDSFWFIWGTFLKHGNNHQVKSMSGSFLVMFVSLFCVIVSAAYCGNLIAFFTITRESVPFKTSAQLVHQSQYRWGTINGSLWQLQIANSNHSDFQKLWQGMRVFSLTEPHVLATSSLIHKKKVEEGDYVFFFDRSVMEIWMSENCQLTLLAETFRQITFGVGLPDNSPYLRTFSKVLMKFEKAGILGLLKRQWWPNINVCKDEQVQVRRRVVELEDLQSAFYVLLSGLCLAGVVLTFEWARHHFPNMRNTKRKSPVKPKPS